LGEDIDVPLNDTVAVFPVFDVEVRPVPFPVISGLIRKSSVGP
jgi:hypothetical protein